MQCPNCQHSSNKILSECPHCGKVYERELLVALDRSTFLVAWLEQRGFAGARAYAALLKHARQELQNAQNALLPPLNLIRPAEEVANEVSLASACIEKIAGWNADGLLTKSASRALRADLEAHLADLKAELGTRPAEPGVVAELAVLDYALAEQADWGKIIGAQQVDNLRIALERRREFLLRPTPIETSAPLRANQVKAAPEATEVRMAIIEVLKLRATPVKAAPEATALPAEIVARKRAEIEAPSRPKPAPFNWNNVWDKIVNAFVSGAVLRGALILGAFMIVLSAAILVGRYWNTFGPAMQLVLIFSVPAAFYFMGWQARTRLRLTQASAGLTAIGALLLAVDFGAVYQLGDQPLSPQWFWFLATLVCSAVYIETARRLPGEFFGYLAGIGVTGVLVALAALLNLLPAWWVAAGTLSGLGCVWAAMRLGRADTKWTALSRALKNFALLLVPATLATNLFVPDPALAARSATFGLGAFVYLVLAGAFPSGVYGYAANLSAALAWYWLAGAVAAPDVWMGAVIAGLGTLQAALGLTLAGRFVEDPHYRAAYERSSRQTGFALLAVALATSIAVLLNDLWASVSAQALICAALAWWAFRLRWPILTLLTSTLFVLPFSLTVWRLLGDAGVSDADLWLACSWSVLAMAYLGVGAALNRHARFAGGLHLAAHRLGLLVGAALLILYRPDGAARPAALCGVGGLGLLYLASAWLADRDRHPAAAVPLSWLPMRVRPGAYLWPFGLVAAIWFGLAAEWGLGQSAKPWLGPLLGGLGLAYIGLGQLLVRRERLYRLPFHTYAYPLAVLGGLFTFGMRLPLTLALGLAVTGLALLGALYRRPHELWLAAGLFLWPFALLLGLLRLPTDSHSLALALLASGAYFPLGRRLERAGRRFALPFYALAYVAASWGLWQTFLAASQPASLLTRAAGALTPLLVTGLLVFSLYRFTYRPFGWAAALLFPLAFVRGLALVGLPGPYYPPAWAALAYAYVLVLRWLMPVRPWLGQLRWPLAVTALLIAGFTFVFSLPFMLLAEFAGPVILTEALIAALAILVAGLFRLRWPMVVEPWLAIIPMTLATTTYGETWIGRPPAGGDFAIMLAGLGLAHLIPAALLDRLRTRYSHGLYLGGYGMLGLAAFAAPTDNRTGVWVLGLGLVASLGSALMVYVGRHRTWQDLLDRWLPRPNGLIRGLVANAFLWAQAGVLPVWIAMLLVELEVPMPYPWLGIAACGLLFQALAFGLRRVRADYPAPFLTGSHLYMLLALLASLPTTRDIFFDHSPFQEVRTFGLGFLLVQGIAVCFYTASAVYHRRPALAHLAAWLTFLPVTLVGIVLSGDVLPRPLADAEFAWLWTLWSAFLLLAGWLLNRQPIRYAHGPYLFGYLLGGFALLWSFSDRLVNLYTFGALLILWLGSQTLVYTGRHRSYEDLLQRFWSVPDNVVRRTAAAIFLFLAAYGFPIWLAQLLAYQEVPVAWRGMAFALTSPLYIAFGLALRRARPEYAWPLFSGGYALTAIGAMLSFEHSRLTIAVLAVIAVVYTVSAYIFQQAFWLYLAAGLFPIIAVLEVRAYHGRLPGDWSSGVLLGLAFVYLSLGQILDRRTPPASPTVGTFALPFYAAGYLMSAIALGIASGSGDSDLAIKVFLAGAALYSLTAWRLREPLFLYPSVWLLPVPYFLLIAQTTLPPQYRGLGWLPFIVALIAVGRTRFQRQPLGIESVRSFFAALTQPPMPFYLLAYALSVLMLGFSQGDLTVFAQAFAAAALLYFGSAALFRTPRWFIPALLSVHLGVLMYFAAEPSGNPAYWISLPFLLVTGLVTLAGLAFQRWLPAKAAVIEEKGPSWLARWPFAGHLVTPSWAQPFFGFAAADVLIWQAVALFGAETTILIGIGHFVLLGLLAQFWLDRGLAYGALAFLLLAAGSRLGMAGIPLRDAAAWIGGIGLGLYLVARLTDSYCNQRQPHLTRLRVWVVPATTTSVILTGLGVVTALPVVSSKPTIAAIAFGFAGALYVAVAYRGQYHRLGYAGMALLLAAWVILLVLQEVSEPQWYAIPAGLYFVTIGFLERLRDRRTFALLVEGFGLAVLLLTSFIQSTNGAAGFPYFVLLLAEGLLVAWWAAVQQRRVPFLTGVAAVVLNVVAQVIVTLRVYDRFRWLIILGVGLMLVALAVVIERRRESIVTQARAWRETIESWD